MYTIWVGGVEVNNYYVDNLTDATKLADYWKSKGYDDVQVKEAVY
jgi:hypothetical protein